MFPGGLDYLFTKTLDDILDFFEYLAHDNWKYDHAREIFNHPSANPYMMHATSLDKGQIGGISYEHYHTPCAPLSYDYCYSF